MKRWIKATGILLVVTAVSTEPASGNASSDDDLAEFEELMQILDEETTVATKTRLNSDYVPGMVTVLHGSDLEALGLTSVWEALGTVPGLQTSRNRESSPFVTVRGLAFPFNSGNIKVLVNSVAMSRETAAISSTVLMMPIEQVERIEVIRGPGSSVYGNFAFLGLVNIVTRKTGGRVFVNTTGGDHHAGGGQVAIDGGTIQLDASVSGWTTNTGVGSIGSASEEDRVFATFGVHHQGTRLGYQIVDREHRTGTEATERNQVFDLRHHRQLTDALSADVEASYLITDAVARDGAFEGTLAQAEIDLGWSGDRYRLFLALSGADANIDRAVLDPIGRPLARAEIVDDGWRSWGVSVQGEFDLGPRATATAGLRHDVREDLNAGRTTPRVALVWRARDEHLLKAQHAQGFRAPSFFELFGLSANHALDFETIATTEFSYIYRDVNRTGRATVFYSRMSNVIFPRAPSALSQTRTFAFQPPPGGPPPGRPPGGALTFQNSGKGTAFGIETEWEQKLTSRVKASANVSYVDAEDTRNAADVVSPALGAARWLANAALIVQPSRNITLAAHLYHVGARKTETDDIDGFDHLDVTVSAFDLPVRGLTLRAAVKNALDSEAAYLQILPTGTTSQLYDARTWWLQLSYSH